MAARPATQSIFESARAVVAVDTSVLVDLLGGDIHADASHASLRAALVEGPVVVCDVVLSELVAGLGPRSSLLDTLDEIGIGYAAINELAAVRAGEMQRRYNARRAAAGRAPASMRTVPDFLIGAHALLQCQALITRDAGFFRDYFKGLKLVVPKAA